MKIVLGFEVVEPQRTSNTVPRTAIGNARGTPASWFRSGLAEGRHDVEMDDVRLALQENRLRQRLSSLPSSKLSAASALSALSSYWLVLQFLLLRPDRPVHAASGNCAP